MPRHKSHRESKFYVFYNKDDFVWCFGTAKQLVAQGYFPSVNCVRSTASKIKAKKFSGAVVILQNNQEI